MTSHFFRGDWFVGGWVDGGDWCAFMVSSEKVGRST